MACRTRGALILGAPHRALLTPPPPPPISSQSSQHSTQHQNSASHVSYTFRSPTGSEATLKQSLSALSLRLRQHHHFKVGWPTAHTEYTGHQTERLHAYLTNTLVMPCLDLLSQLRAYFIKEPLQQISRNPEDGVSIITITNVLPFPASFPIVLFVADGFGDAIGEVTRSPLLSRYLTEAWKSDPAAKVICSDLKSLFVFKQDLKSGPRTVIFERLSVDPDLVVIQVVITAYISAALTAGTYYDSYFAHPWSTKIFDPPEVLGCLPDPSKPLLTDTAVFATHDRQSDFDLYTLKSSPPRALQFLRWKTYITDNIDKINILRPGDSVTASTGGFSRYNATLRPYWPVDLESIPTSTMEHLRVIGRPPPLDEDTQSRLSESTQFRITLLERLGGERNPVYRCEITAVDDQPVPPNIPPLCLKLFDDRLLPTHAPDDPDEHDVGPDQTTWISWRTSEDLVRHEHAIYQQLAFAQGATVPWYYGAHRFVLPDGHWVYGVLLEYIPGVTVSKAIPTMKDTDRCALVQAARHSLRVLQYADVSQHDWHDGQVLALSSPTPHTVLLDFARASVSTEPENHESNDYNGLLTVLKKPLRSAGMTAASILEHYGEPEVWDRAACTWRDDDGKSQLLQSEDPYDWIYRRIES